MNENNLFKKENIDSRKERKHTGFTIEFESTELKILKGEVEKVEDVSGPVAFEVGDIFHIGNSDDKVEVISVEETEDSDKKLIKYRLIKRIDK